MMLPKGNACGRNIQNDSDRSGLSKRGFWGPCLASGGAGEGRRPPISGIPRQPQNSSVAKVIFVAGCSQRVKWTSGARVMINSLSLDRSIHRSTARVLDRSISTLLVTISINFVWTGSDFDS